MDEGLQFVARRLAGEAMSDLCREFGISRKTGYKIFDRYQECGIQGLTEEPPSVSLRQPTSFSGRELHSEREEGAPQLGCSQNSRALNPPIFRCSDPGQEHHPCASGSLRAGRSARSRASSRPGHAPVFGAAPP